MSNSIPLENTTVLPLLPLRDVVVFPHMVIPLFVGRPKSIKALEAAMEEGKNVVLVAQKSAANDDPTPEDLYAVGSVASILQMLKLPDGTVKVLVEGVHRARIHRVINEKENYEAEVSPIPQDEGDNNEVEAMRRSLFAQFDQYVKLNKKIPPEVLTSLSGIDSASGCLMMAFAATAWLAKGYVPMSLSTIVAPGSGRKLAKKSSSDRSAPPDRRPAAKVSGCVSARIGSIPPGMFLAMPPVMTIGESWNASL